jgi:hypothetical protein
VKRRDGTIAFPDLKGIAMTAYREAGDPRAPTLLLLHVAWLSAA